MFPSPGTAQSVWSTEPGAGQSCSMVSGPVSSDNKDINSIPFSESTEFNVGHTYKSVFDLVRNG